MPGIGDSLRESRMRQKIDITDVEVATKIRAKYLRALENEEWDLMPGPTFVRTFLRTYAQYLGLDAHLSSRSTAPSTSRAASPTSSSSSPPAPRRGREARPRRRPGRGLAVVAAVLALIGFLLLLGLTGEDEGNGSKQQAESSKQQQTATDKRSRRSASARRRRRPPRSRSGSRRLSPPTSASIAASRPRCSPARSSGRERGRGSGCASTSGARRPPCA